MIKENMKAGYGIVFREGDHHVDRGPPHSDFRQPGLNYQYSLTEYSRLANQPIRSSHNATNTSDLGPNYARGGSAKIQVEQL